MGYIYIMTSPSFPELVKIGYAENVKKRLDEFNRQTVLPYGLRTYATYKVKAKLTDKKVHEIIDTLNPDLRCIENLNGKERKREYFAMKPEDAYNLLKAIAEINDSVEDLEKTPISKDDKITAQLAKTAISKANAFVFDSIGIKPGDKIELWHYNKKILTCEVIDNKHVKYNDEVISLSALVQKELKIAHPAGPSYFKYKGEWINDIRRKMGTL